MIAMIVSSSLKLATLLFIWEKHFTTISFAVLWKAMRLACSRSTCNLLALYFRPGCGTNVKH